MHDRNSFITLTYNDEHLPANYSVSRREVQLFIKRLRKHVSPTKLRFFACGEYGDKNYRPHYHILVFGYDFPDKRILRQTKTTHNRYVSEVLQNLWEKGTTEIGDVNYTTAAYCARYALKKVGGPQADDYYRRIHPTTHQLVRVLPEFIQMSTRPGIGTAWWTKYRNDCFPSDYLIVDGKRHVVPRYYLRKLDQEKIDNIKLKRTIKELKRRKALPPNFLQIKAHILHQRLQQLKREL